MNNPFTDAKLTRSEYADFIAAVLDTTWDNSHYDYLCEGAKYIIANTMWACYDGNYTMVMDSLADLRNYAANLAHSDKVAALNDRDVVLASLNDVINTLNSGLSQIEK